MSRARLGALVTVVLVAMACDALVGIPGNFSDGPASDAAVEAPEGADAGADAHDTDAHPLDAGGPSCPIDAAMGNLCDECRNEYCCGPYLRCHDSPACQDFINCAAACNGNDACELECIKKNDAGYPLAPPGAIVVFIFLLCWSMARNEYRRLILTPPPGCSYVVIRAAGAISIRLVRVTSSLKPIVDAGSLVVEPARQKHSIVEGQIETVSLMPGRSRRTDTGRSHRAPAPSSSWIDCSCSTSRLSGGDSRRALIRGGGWSAQFDRRPSTVTRCGCTRTRWEPFCPGSSGASPRVSASRRGRDGSRSS